MHHRFWAKTPTMPMEFTYKSVAHHCLDVAATTLRFLQANPRRLQREAALSGLQPDRHAQLCALMAGLHDVGKFSISFQALQPDLWPTAVLGPCPADPPRRLRHWEATALIVRSGEVGRLLAPVFGSEGIPDPLLAAVAGHHGEAPQSVHCAANEHDAARERGIGARSVEAAAQFVAELVDLFPDLRNVDVGSPEIFSLLSNGLITLADWVGSDTEFFRFESPEMRAACYWPLALQRAGEAMHEKGLVPAVPKSNPSLAALSPHADPPRPMQAKAVDLQMVAEPQIIVIEDGTGSGKTEAALLIAARMMAAGLGEGVFVALPTMATANAMHGRLERALGGLFEGDASLVLAHGKSQIASALDRLGDDERRTEDGEPAVRSWFNAWIADSRKKAFFASAGAGTIDQAFLCVLPKKHLTLRQYALAGRILIVDEAHMCDAYMGEELKTLVELQARFGGSVIILSATLGRSMRADLLWAFANGRGAGKAGSAFKDQVASTDYPLLSRWSMTTGVEEVRIEAAPGLSRSIEIERIADRAEAVGRARAAADRGAAVAIICNAVDAATATWQALLDAGQDPERCHLFHARFVVEDRLAVEQQVQTWFGRESGPEDRRGRILVATQVIEQSLDVDFDVLISDLAPADLIVQRAGRLCRHFRKERPVEKRVLHLLSPEPGAAVEADWLEQVLGPGAFVYDLPGVMWRSARDLLGTGHIETPAGLRRLIEAAYEVGADDLPTGLVAKHDASLGRTYGERSQGRRNTITPDFGYLALSAVSADEDIGTRLGADSTTIRLARREGDTLVPLRGRPGANERLDWALSEVTVRKKWLERGCAGSMPQPADPRIVEKVRIGWPEWERTIPLFEVGEDGQLLTSPREKLQYGNDRGLSLISSAQPT